MERKRPRTEDDRESAAASDAEEQGKEKSETKTVKAEPISVTECAAFVQALARNPTFDTDAHSGAKRLRGAVFQVRQAIFDGEAPTSKRRRSSKAKDVRLCSPNLFVAEEPRDHSYVFIRPVGPRAEDVEGGESAKELIARTEKASARVFLMGGAAEEPPTDSDDSDMEGGGGRRASKPKPVDAAVTSGDGPAGGSGPKQPALAVGVHTHKGKVEDEEEAEEAALTGEPIQLPRPAQFAALDEYLAWIGKTYYHTPEIGSSSEYFSLIRRATLGVLRSPLRTPTIIDKWSPIEIALFESSVCLFGKDFEKIKQVINTNKTTEDVIEFWYAWKRSKNYKKWKETYRAPAIIE